MNVAMTAMKDSWTLQAVSASCLAEYFYLGMRCHQLSDASFIL
jgi:hypothetical protein